MHPAARYTAADFPKDQSKIPGGQAGGAALAARPEEDRRESSRKAAVTRRQNQVRARTPQCVARCLTVLQCVPHSVWLAV
jgi:hypothetical protein